MSGRAQKAPAAGPTARRRPVGAEHMTGAKRRGTGREETDHGEDTRPRQSAPSESTRREGRAENGGAVADPARKELRRSTFAINGWREIGAPRSWRRAAVIS